MDKGDISNIIKGASLTMKAEGNGKVSIEAKGSGAALMTLAAACLAQLSSQMGDAAPIEKAIHKFAKKIIENGILEKDAEG